MAQVYFHNNSEKQEAVFDYFLENQLLTEGIQYLKDFRFNGKGHILTKGVQFLNSNNL